MRAFHIETRRMACLSAALSTALFMLLVAMLCGASAASAAQVTYKDFQAGSTAVSGQKVVFRLFVPKGYDPGRQYPLMVTLHGAGERGLDDSLHLTHYFNRIWADSAAQAIRPAFVLAPQCPWAPAQWVNTPWAKGTYNSDTMQNSVAMQAVLKIMDSLESAYSLDKSRYYVSGISMGGYGAWSMLMKNPNRFAAAVPVCGAADTAKAALIAQIPVWNFHAADDGTVPVAGSRQMIAALQKAGGTPKYTEYPASQGVGHGSWAPAAETPGLVQWVYSQVNTTVTIKPLAAPHRDIPSRFSAGPRLFIAVGERTYDIAGRSSPANSVR